MSRKQKKTLLQELVALSRSLGSNPEFVLAGGGNTSYKDEKIIWIKASGFELGNITEEGFVLLDREKLRRIRSKKYPQEAHLREEEVKKDLLSARIKPELGQTPSVETYFHELIDYPWVVHLHPWPINALTCSQKGKLLYQEILGKDTLWIDFCTPGYTLARIIEREINKFLKDYQKYPQLILLENHGVILWGETPEEVRKKINEVIEKIKTRLTLLEGKKKKPLLDPSFISLCIQKALGEKRRIIYYLECVKIPEEITKGAFTPDQIVYCKEKPVWIDNVDLTAEKIVSEINLFLKQEKYKPKVVAINGIGIFGIGENWKVAKNAALVFRDALRIYDASFSFGGPKFLDKEYVEFIDNWEVERYRRRIAEGLLKER
ncbi:class II aldolase [Candidatus Calescamantes bacterium]|nr:class II aldolase [Candidatus Calescamantes bacterium]